MSSYQHAEHRTGRLALLGLLWSSLNAVVSTGLTAVVFAITSRILSPSDFGAVAFAASIIAIGLTIVPMAFGDAIIQRKNLSKSHLDTVFWLIVVLGICIWMCLFFGAELLSGLFQVETLAYILPILSLRILFDALGCVPNALIIRDMAFKKVAIRTTIANGLAAVICLTLAVNGFAFWALVLSQLVGAGIQAVFSCILCGWRPGFSISFKAFQDLKSFGLFTMGRRFLDVAKLEQFLIGSFMGAPVLGLYFFAFRLNEMIQQLATASISQVFGVTFAGLQDNTDRLRDVYLKGCFGAAAVSFPVFSGLIFMAPDIIPILFGAQWDDAILAVQALAGLSLIASIGSLQAALIQAVGQAGWWLYYRIFVQLGGFAIIAALAPLGLDAVVLGLFLRTLLLWPMSVRRVLTILGMDMRQYLHSFIGPALAASGMIAGQTVLRACLEGIHPLLQSSVLIGTGMITYIIILFLLGWDHIVPAWNSMRNVRKRQVT